VDMENKWLYQLRTSGDYLQSNVVAEESGRRLSTRMSVLQRFLGSKTAICRTLQPLQSYANGSIAILAETAEHPAAVHFKKKKTVTMETAKALGELILAAQRALRAREDLIGR
jgi:hypothetical protein